MFPHLPVPLEYFFQKGVREEGKPLAYREPAASFAGDADRFLVRINITDLNPLYLPSSQTAGGVEGEDAQIPAMNEKAELMSLSAIEQVLVMLSNAAQQPHQLEGRGYRLKLIPVLCLDVELSYRIGADEPAEPHGAKEAPQDNLYNLERELLVVLGFFKKGEILPNTRGIDGAYIRFRVCLLQPGMKEAEMPVVVADGLVGEDLIF